MKKAQVPSGSFRCLHPVMMHFDRPALVVLTPDEPLRMRERPFLIDQDLSTCCSGNRYAMTV
jgi:hypothetical protein